MNLYKSKEMRRAQSIEKLKLYGIDYIENLPVTYEANEVKIKSIEDIAKRYIANIISIQVAYDLLNNADVDCSLNFFNDLLNMYESRDALNELERKVLRKELGKKELVNLTWQYESLNVLSWVLGLKKDLNFPNEVCDASYLVEVIATSKNLSEFIVKCNIIDVETILDELDLEYRYHWAIVDKRINPSTNAVGLDEEIVVERRRALEWLFEDIDDWNKISLNT